MELGTGCAYIEEQPNGDFRLQCSRHPDPHYPAWPTVLIPASNVDAIIKYDRWYILQVKHYVQINDSESHRSNIGHPSELRFFANFENCRIMRLV